MRQELNHPTAIGDNGVSQMIDRANPQDEEAIKELLAACDLPYQDLTVTYLENFLVLRNEGKLVGCAGMEIYTTDALLRSMAVREGLRNHGLGTRLLGEIEAAAWARGIQTVYLLTTTAEIFFHRHGYTRIEHRSAPDALQGSQEFQSLCPSTAICMHKRLSFT
jgi:amino-acid N-acetyltransferase